MKTFYSIALITDQKCNIIDDNDDYDDNNNHHLQQNNDDDDKGEYAYVRFKFEKIKVILQNAQSTYLHIEIQS
jgi:hypothetical protein